MRSAFFAVLAVLLGLTSAAQAELVALDGQPVAPTALLRGRVAVLFVVVPGVDDTSRVVAWLDGAMEAWPDVFPFVLAPEDTSDLRAVAESYPELTVLIDQHATFGRALGIQDVPALVTLLDGRIRERLAPPFTRAELEGVLEALAAAERRGPMPLVDTAAPAFDGESVDGELRSLHELPLPAILVFLSPGCPFCWDLLEELETLEEDIPIALLVEADSLTADYKARLEGFLHEAPGDWQLVLTPEGVRGAYRVLATPTLFLLDDRATIRTVLEGVAPGPIVENEVRLMYADLEQADP